MTNTKQAIAQGTMRGPEQKSAQEAMNAGEFHRLFVAWSDRVYRWALFLGVDGTSAEEITQDVFVTVCRKEALPKADPVLAAFLFQITRRHVSNHRRNSWVRRVLKLEDLQRSLEMECPDDNEGTAMRQILAQMPLKLVEVLLLHDLDGYSRTEISKILGIAEGTVASRLRTARAGFIEKWSGENHE